MKERGGGQRAGREGTTHLDALMASVVLQIWPHALAINHKRELKGNIDRAGADWGRHQSTRVELPSVLE